MDTWIRATSTTRVKINSQRSTCCHQCCILTRKHWLERTRKWSAQLMHAVFPIIAVVSLIALQAVADNLYRPGVEYSPPVSTSNYQSICFDDAQNATDEQCSTLVYAPSSVSWVNDILESTVSSLVGDTAVTADPSRYLSPLPDEADISQHRWCLSGPGTAEYECPGLNCSRRYPICNDTLIENFPSTGCFAQVLQSNDLLMPCAFFKDNATLTELLVSGSTIQNAVLFVGAYLQESIPDSLEELSASVNASLRQQFWNYNLLYNSSRNVFPKYEDDYALSVKNALDESILAHRLGWEDGVDFDASYFNFPQPPAALSKFDVVAEFGALWFFLPGLALFYSVLVSVVGEKENKFRIGLQMMGMRTSVFWATWLLVGTLFSVVSALFLVFTARACQVTVFANTDWFVFILLYVCYGFAMVGFAIAIASCVKTVRVAQSVAWVVILVGFIFQAMLTIANSSLLQIVYLSEIPGWLKNDPRGDIALLTTSVLRNILWIYPPFHVAKGYHDIASFAAYNFDFVSQEYSPPTSFSFSQIMDVRDVELLSGYDYVATMPSLFLTLCVLVANGTVYACLGLVVDVALDKSVAAAGSKTDNRAGCVAQCCRRENAPKNATQEDLTSSDGRQPVVKLTKLGKKYNQRRCCLCGRRGSGRANATHTQSNSLWALRDLDLRCYRNEILCLLGHNGAGKSTTISLLVGLIAPTEGSVTINASSQQDAAVTSDDSDEELGQPPATMSHTKVHRSLLVGVCPQYDVLWPTLTAEEHLRMFARLKGVKTTNLDAEIEDKLKLVDLHSRSSRTKRAAAMSGGMRRRLSVAISVIGEPPVVVLDEPTTGIDPFHQMELWQAIDRLKHDRTILLTTHNMEEAETLASRVAVLQGGQLRHLGTALGLKNALSSSVRMVATRCAGLPAGATSIEEWASDLVTKYGSSHATAAFGDKLSGPIIRQIGPLNSVSVELLVHSACPLQTLAWLLPRFQTAQTQRIISDWKLEQLGSLQSYMNPDFVPQDENRASETTSSVMELSRASILQETAASFGQARIESDAFSPLAVDRRQASVQGGLQQRTRGDDYQCLWCFKFGALLRKKFVLQSRQWCQNMCLVLTCAMTIVVLIILNTVVADQLALVDGSSSGVDAAAVSSVVPSLPVLLGISQAAMIPEAYVFGNVLFTSSTQSSSSTFFSQASDDDDDDSPSFGDCAVLFDVRDATDANGHNVTQLLSAFPSSLCTFINSSLTDFGQTVTSTSQQTCQRWDADDPHDLSWFWFDQLLQDDQMDSCQDPFNEGTPWCFVDNPDIEFEWCFSNVHLQSPVFSVQRDLAESDSDSSLQKLQEELYAHVDFETILDETLGDYLDSHQKFEPYGVLRNGVPDAAIRVETFNMSSASRQLALSYTFAPNTLSDPGNGAYSYHRDNGFFVDDPGERSFLFVDSSVSTTAMRARVMETLFQAVSQLLLPAPDVASLEPFIALLTRRRSRLLFDFESSRKAAKNDTRLSAEPCVDQSNMKRERNPNIASTPTTRQLSLEAAEASGLTSSLASTAIQGCALQGFQEPSSCVAGTGDCVDSDAGDLTLRYRLPLNSGECAQSCITALGAQQFGLAETVYQSSCKCFAGKAPSDFTIFTLVTGCSIDWPDYGVLGMNNSTDLDLSEVEASGGSDSTALYDIGSAICSASQFSVSAQELASEGAASSETEGDDNSVREVEAEAVLYASVASTLNEVVNGNTRVQAVTQLHRSGVDPVESCADTCLRQSVSAQSTSDLPRLNSYYLIPDVACYWNSYVSGVDWFYISQASEGEDSSFSVSACAEACMELDGCTGFEFVPETYCASWMNNSCSTGNELHVLNNNPTITGFISASASSLQTCTDEEGWVSNIGFTCRDYAILSICVNFGLIEYVDWGSFTDPDSNADGNADFMHRDSNGVPVTHACCSCRLHYDLEASQFNVSSPQFDEQTIANSTAVYYARASSGLWRTFVDIDFKALATGDFGVDDMSLAPSALPLEGSFPFLVPVASQETCRQYCGFFPECAAYSFHQNAEPDDDDYQQCFFYTLVFGAARPIVQLQRPGYVSGIRVYDDPEWSCSGFATISGVGVNSTYGVGYGQSAQESVCLLFSDGPLDMTSDLESFNDTRNALRAIPFADLLLTTMEQPASSSSWSVQFCDHSNELSGYVNGMDEGDVDTWMESLRSMTAEDPSLLELEYLINLLGTSAVSTFPYSLTPPLLAAVDLLGLLVYPILFMFQMPILAYVLVWEKQERLRRLQRGAGVSAALYYTSHYALCLIIYLLTIATCWVCGYAASIRFFHETSWKMLVSLSLSGGNVVVALSWILAAFFRDKQAVVVVGLLIVFVGHALSIVVVAGFFGQPIALMPSLSASTVLPPGLLVVPQFAIARAIYILVIYCAASHCVADTSALYGGYGSATESGGIGGDGLSELGACFVALAGFAIVFLPSVAALDWYYSQGRDGNSARNAKCCDGCAKRRHVNASTSKSQDIPNLWTAARSERYVSLSTRPQNSKGLRWTRRRPNRPTTMMVEMQDITSTGVANPTHAPSTAASSQPTDDHQLVMHIDDVHKIWADGKHAVKGISLKVRYGDTFALLGVNGAGKSSLLTMIAGSTSITKGNISVFGEKLPSLIHGDVPKRRRTFSRIGICPQHDALWGTLNPEEHLHLFARLKLRKSRNGGVRARRQEITFHQAVQDAVELALQQADLASADVRRRPADKLSGGMRRRLSVAMALIGDVELLVLDEPSTGLDPWAQLDLWKMLSRWRASSPSRHTLMLCTHDMAEAELLCERFAILNDGVLLADGDCPSLLRRFNCDILTVHVEFASITLDGGGILMATQQFETFLDEVETQFPMLMRGTRSDVLALQLENSIKVDLFKQHAHLGNALRWLSEHVARDEGSASTRNATEPLFSVKHWYIRDSGLRKIFEVAMGVSEELGGDHMNDEVALTSSLPDNSRSADKIDVSGRLHTVM